jgi:two-component sensor histidine kinase
MSLRQRLFVPVVTALLPIVAINAYNQIELYLAREKEIQESALAQAKQVAAEQQRIIDGVKDVLSTLVVLNSVRRQQTVRCEGLFEAVLPRYRGFLALVATRADGSPFCAASAAGSISASNLPSVAGEPFFREAMAERRLTVGGYAFDRHSSAHVFRLAMPMLDADRARGVVYVSYNLDWLASRLGGTQWREDQVFSIADRNGVVLVRQPSWASHVGKSTPTEAWTRVMAATEPFAFEDTSSWDGVSRIFGVIPPIDGPGGLTVAVGRSRETAFAALNAATLRGALVIVLGTTVGCLLAWLIGLRLVRTPIKRLLETTRRWRCGDLSARTNLSGRSEFGQLGSAFDGMAEELGQAIQFKDVALRELRHRVMNNLQIMSAMFNMQARTAHNPEVRAQLGEAVGRINSMALAYRRMHSSDESEVVEFAGYLRELCAAISDSLMQDHGCKVEASSILLGPQQASSLALIVNELVTNAIKHGGRSSPVYVKLEKTEESCRLAVRNEGLLPRDYDAKRSPGFGMQMVLMLVNQLGGQLDISNESGQTEFAITFSPTIQQTRQDVA